MKLHLTHFLIMIYQSRFPARWLTQPLFRLAVDIKSNPSPSQVNALSVHVEVGVGVHAPKRNTIPTQTTHKQTPLEQQHAKQNIHMDLLPLNINYIINNWYTLHNLLSSQYKKQNSMQHLRHYAYQTT